MAGASDLAAEVVLIGTGLAPLLTAKSLNEQGRSVLVLNPDWSFFQEDSELPFDPEPGSSPALTAESLLGLLRPPFPGAVEWSPLSDVSRPPGSGFRVVSAPYVRTRSRIRIVSPLETDFEERFLKCEEQGHRPLEYRDLAALRRFPGYASPQTGAYGVGARGVRGLSLLHQWDADVRRYRVGVHEFLLDRIGSERVRTALTDIEPLSVAGARTGIRFRSGDDLFQIPRCDRVLVFWTPRLSHWLERLGAGPRPRADVWERWTLISRENLLGELSGEFEDLWVMPELEGEEDASFKLSVFRRAPEVARESILNDASFDALSRLCLGLMGWDKFSIRSYRVQERFREVPQVTPLSGVTGWSVVRGADGPLTAVVQAAQLAFTGVV